MKKADELAIHQHVRPKYRELEGCFVNDSQSWKGRSNMKKQMTLMLVLLLVLTACFSNSAFALNYTGNLGNASTFETMTEVRANAIQETLPTFTVALTCMAAMLQSV